MLSEYIPDNGSEVYAERLGQLTARIHSIRLPRSWDVDLVAMEGRTDALATIVQSVLRRSARLVKKEASTRSWGFLIREELEPIAESLKSRCLPLCLLHMDLRDVNLIRALVFIAEAPDPERSKECISRVEELCQALRSLKKVC
jgi:hypothetical protein